MRTEDQPTNAEAEAPPPILGSWGRMYLLVLGSLALVVVLFALLTRAYS